jgi:hypothetical protein
MEPAGRRKPQNGVEGRGPVVRSSRSLSSDRGQPNGLAACLERSLAGFVLPDLHPGAEVGGRRRLNTK